MLQINGREIFQKERVDKELSREPATVLARQPGNWKPWMELRKLYDERNDGRVREAWAARFAGLGRF
jgi:hypothetical protein